MDTAELKMPSVDYRNVLIVDDEPAIHEVCEAFLQPDPLEVESSTGDPDDRVVVDFADTRNFRVLHAESGEEAISIATKRAQGLGVQVAFIDLKMKGLSGFETIRRLQETDPRIIFAIVTGFPADAHEQIADELGPVAIEIIAKPFDASRIHQGAANMCSRWEQVHGF